MKKALETPFQVLQAIRRTSLRKAQVNSVPIV